MCCGAGYLWQKDLGVPPRQAQSQGVCSHLLTLEEAGESGKAEFQRDESGVQRQEEKTS